MVASRGQIVGGLAVISQDKLDRAIALAAKFIAGHEACKLDAYPDPGSKDGHPWTIGYGSTRGVVKGMRINSNEALDRLVIDLRHAVNALLGKLNEVADELTVHQLAALISFVFNLGTGDPAKPEWTIWKLLRGRAFDQIPAQMIRFVYNDGKKMQGLVNRRADEVKLWSTEEPGSVPDSPPSSVTRVTPTPPAATDPVPPQRSAQIITAVAGAVAVVPVAANQVTATLAPYASQSPLLQRVVSVLAVVAAVAAVTVLVLTWLKKQRERR